MTDDRDPLVGRALGVIDPVAPRPGFWAELEARLHQEEQGAPVLELARVAGGRPGLAPAERRRRFGLAATAVAAAALLVLGFVAFAGDGRDHERTASPPPGPDGSTTTAVPGPDATPDEITAYVADRWIATAATADAEAAWELLGPQSREAIRTPEQLAGISSTSSLFSWGRVQGRTQVALSDDGVDQLVVFRPVGDEVPMALVVIDAGSLDTARIEAYLPGRSLGLIGLQPGQTVGPEAALPLSIDADAAGFAAVFDGVAAPSGWIQRAGTPPGGIVALSPRNGLSPGRHWLAVAMRTPGDVVALDVVTFQAAG